MTGKIIANALTISHILESYITTNQGNKGNQGEPSETIGNCMKTVKKSSKNMFGSALEIIA
jgi:hypothetical protein